MQDTIEMTEEKAFDQDVTTMSYEELMASIRYLDEERQRLSRHINDKNGYYSDKNAGEIILKRVA